MTAAAILESERDQLAKWYAKRHRETDKAVERIMHLPTGAGDREIRFLEVNRLIAETTPLEPIDFGVDIDGANPHTLLVLDVTPGQWEAIQAQALPLPAGWSLEGVQTLEGR